jgi:hypothetical protein
MDLIVVLGWLLYGIIVGLISKAIYKGVVPSGFLSTLVVGIIGSFAGGFIKYMLTDSGDPFQPSGILFGVVGGILTCFLHKKIKEL